MGGWSGVALSGLGAGIGKALEPDNIMRIKQFTDEIKWSEAAAKIDADVDAKYKNENNLEVDKTESPAKKIPTPEDFSSKTGLPSNTLSRDSQSLMDSMTESDTNNISQKNTATVEVVDKAPKPYAFKPDDNAIRLIKHQKRLELAMKMGNMKAAQEEASKYDYFNKKHAERIQGAAVEAYLTENPELFAEALNMFHFGKGESLPDEFKGIPQFIKGGINSLTGLPETYLQFNSGLRITPSDLNHMFRADFGNLTQPDSFSGRRMGGGSGSSKSPLFFNLAANGEAVDATGIMLILQNQLSMSRKDNPNYSLGNPLNANEVFFDVLKFLGMARPNQNLVNGLMAMQYNPAEINSPGNPIHSFLAPLQVQTDNYGKIVFENDEIRERIEPYIMHLPSKNSDGTMESKYYIDIAKVAQDYYSSSIKEEKQQEENPNRLIEIARGYGEPFPTGNDKAKLKDARTKWQQGLTKYILRTEDFGVTDAPRAYHITSQIHDFYLRQPASIINREDITKKEVSNSEKRPLVSQEQGSWAQAKLGIPNDEFFYAQQAAQNKNTGVKTYENYDYLRANEVGLTPDPDGHWPSVNEATKEEIKDYRLPDGSFYSLKQYNHPTLNLSVDEESKLGRKPVQHILNKVIFFIPKDAPLPPNMIDYKVDMQSGQTNNQNTQNTQNNKNIEFGIGKKTVRSIRNNNAGVLEFRGQPGATSDGRFAIFETPQEGVNALNRQIIKDGRRGHTLASFIHKYAPRKENKTLAYIDFVSEKTGIGYFDKIAGKDTTAIAKAITEMEGGKEALNYFFPNDKNTNLMANNTVSTNQNASQKLNSTFPIAIMNPVLAMNAGNNLKLQSIQNTFKTAMNDVSAMYNKVKKSLTNTGKKPKVNKNNEGSPFDEAASIASYLGGMLKVFESKKENNTGIGKSTSSEFEISSMLRPLPAKWKLLFSSFMVKATPGVFKDFNFSNLFGSTDVEAFASILKSRPLGKVAGIEGKDWDKINTDLRTTTDRQFSYGGFTYLIKEQDKNGYPTKFIFRDTYDFDNKQRAERVKQIERDKKNLGNYKAFVKNFGDSYKHVTSKEFKKSLSLYGGPVNTTASKEFFARVYGEFAAATGDNPSFDCMITATYDDNGKVISHTIKQIPTVRKK